MLDKDKKYLIIKEKNDPAITYFEYDNMEGYDLSPKKNVKIKDAINVNKVVIINPSLMNKVASKKVNLKFKRLLQLVTIIFESDDETGDAYREGLNEISKLRLEAKTRYYRYMKQEEAEMIEKKLDILEQELRIRLYYLEQTYQNDYSNDLGGKSR